MKNLTFFTVLIIIFISCKKENPVPLNEEISTNNYTLTLDNSDYNQLEIISFEKSGISHSLDLYSGMIGSDSVGVAIDGNMISFIAPFNVQSNVTLKVSIDGVEYESTPFNVNQIINIGSPDVVFGDLINLKTSLSNFTNVLIDTMANYSATFNTSTYTSDQNIIDNHWITVNQNFQALTNSEKEYVATFIKGNEHLFQDCVNDIEDFVHSIPPYMPKSTDIDLEEMNRERAVKMVKATKSVGRIISIAVAGGMIVSATATPIAGVVTAGIILGWNGDVFRTLVAEYDIFSRSALSLIIDELTMTKVNINFEDDVTHPLEIKSNYRSLNSQTDFSSTLMNKVKIALDFIYENYNRISTFFSFTTPVENVDNITSYETYNLDIHAKYITITDISNSDVELISQTNNNGTLDVKFSNSQPGTIQNFTFKLNYESDFGKTSKIIDASIGAEPLAWVTLPYATPDVAGFCDGSMYWEWSGGISPFQVTIGGVSQAPFFPNVGGPYQPFAFCAGNSFTMVVTDANQQSISHTFIVP